MTNQTSNNNNGEKKMSNRNINLIVVIAIICVTIISAVVAVVLTNNSKVYTYETDDFVFTRKGNEVQVASLKNTKAKKIEIPSEVDGFKVTGIGEGAFKGAEVLENVVLDTNITTIGKDAFKDAKKLSSVLMKGVISIGEGAFSGCTNLQTVNMPASLTSIGAYAFKDTSSFHNFSYKFDEKFVATCNLTSVGEGAFMGGRLNTIIIPSSLKTINKSAFEDAALSRVIFYEGVVSIGTSSFAHKDNGGNSMNIYTYNAETASKLAEEGVTADISEIYRVCDKDVFPTSLETIGDKAFMKSGDTYGKLFMGSVKFPANLKSIGREAFRGTSISGIDFANKDTTIGAYAFSNLTSSLNVIMPTAIKKVEEGTFFGTSVNSYRKITLPATVESIEIGAFSGMKNAVTIEIDAKSPVASKVKFISGDGYNALVSIDGKTLYSVLMNSYDTVVKVPAGVEVIEKYAFSYVACNSNSEALSNASITIPESVKTIKAGAFTDAYITSYYVAHTGDKAISIDVDAFKNNKTNFDYVVRARKDSKALTTLTETFKDSNKVVINTYEEK